MLIPWGLNDAKSNPRLILSSTALGFSSFKSIKNISPGLSGAKLFSPGYFKPCKIHVAPILVGTAFPSPLLPAPHVLLPPPRCHQPHHGAQSLHQTSSVPISQHQAQHRGQRRPARPNASSRNELKLWCVAVLWQLTISAMHFAMILFSACPQST